MRRLLILLFSVSLLAAACGGDDDSSGDDDVAADDAGDDGTGADDDDGSADDATDDGGDDDADATDDDGDQPTGDGVGSDFCETYNDASGEGFNPVVLSPEELEDWYRDNLQEIDDVRGSAPSEIRDDVDTLFASFVDVIDALDDVDWDFFAIDENDPVFDNPEAEAASDRVDAYCDDGTDDATDEIPGLDPDVIEDLQEGFENADPDQLGLQFYELLGHDEETAKCLLDELGSDFDFDEAGPEIMSQEFCGLTLLQILMGGAGDG